MASSLVFLQSEDSLQVVSLVRANWVASLAAFLWALVGAFAGDRWVCDDLMASCEHAGIACAQEDDCSDCFKSAASSILADEVVGLGAEQGSGRTFVC